LYTDPQVTQLELHVVVFKYELNFISLLLSGFGGLKVVLAVFQSYNDGHLTLPVFMGF